MIEIKAIDNPLYSEEANRLFKVNACEFSEAWVEMPTLTGSKIYNSL